MNLTIETTKAEGAERRIRVSVAASEVAARTEAITRSYAASARLPGFRKGHAPPAMVRRKFGQQIRQEAVETLLREAYQAVVEREKLQPVTQPHAHDVKFAEGEPLTFELHCEVRPDVTLARVHGLRVTRPKAVVSDAMVREQIDRMREARAAWAPVQGRAAEGDLVTVRLASANEAGTMGEATEYQIELGSGQAIAGVEELILACEPGQTIERAVRWPDDFPDAAEAGRIKTVRVTLAEVKRKTLPPLDDAFARELGDFESIDALERAVREDLEAQAAREAEAVVRGRLVDEIIAANPFPVPPSWVARLLSVYAEAYGVPEADRQRFAREFGPTAERQVRRDVIIDTLAAREKLSATEQDLDDRIAELALKRGTDPGALYASLQKAGRLAEIERSITEERVFAWLYERNTIVAEE